MGISDLHGADCIEKTPTGTLRFSEQVETGGSGWVTGGVTGAVQGGI